MGSLESISLDFSQWQPYKTVEPFVMLGASVRGLTQRCYEREFDGELVSAGVFEMDGEKTHVAWGIKSDPHCSYHALAQDNGWGRTVVGCPEYGLLRYEGRLRGFSVDGAIFVLSSVGNHWDTVKDKLCIYAPLIVSFALVLAWATWRNPIGVAGSAHASHEWISATVHYFHDWMYDFMGGFFLLFGALKVINIKQFAATYSTYDLVARRYKAWGFVYPVIEITLGILYTMRLFLLPANLATLVLMHVSAAGIYIKLRKKEETTCACLGGYFSVPLGVVTLVEDFLMACMALMALAAQVLR